MKTIPFLLFASMFFLAACSAPEETEAEASTPPETAESAETEPVAEEPVEISMKPKVRLETSAGNIVLELNREKAPATVENFLGYVEDGFYENTVFHRVMEGFMIQGGGFGLQDGGQIRQKETKSPIQNEAKNGLQNARGTIAMARTPDPHSATAQFFINHGDNSNLDYPSGDGWGYAVFGKVIEGLDVVDQIAGTATSTKVLTTKRGEAEMENVPVNTIVIQSATLVP